MQSQLQRVTRSVIRSVTRSAIPPQKKKNERAFYLAPKLQPLARTTCTHIPTPRMYVHTLPVVQWLPRGHIVSFCGDTRQAHASRLVNKHSNDYGTRFEELRSHTTRAIILLYRGTQDASGPSSAYSYLPGIYTSVVARGVVKVFSVSQRSNCFCTQKNSQLRDNKSTLYFVYFLPLFPQPSLTHTYNNRSHITSTIFLLYI